MNWYWDYAEQVRANRALLAMGEHGRWLRPATGALAAFAAVSIVLIAFASSDERARMASSLLPLVFVVGCVLAFCRYSAIMSFAQAYRDTPDAQRPITVTISDDGYHTASHSASRGHPWTDFRGARETNEFVFLLLTGRGSFYIPRRIFGVEDDLLAVRAILRAHLAERARLMDAGAIDPHPSAAPSS